MPRRTRRTKRGTRRTKRGTRRTKRRSRSKKRVYRKNYTRGRRGGMNRSPTVRSKLNELVSNQDDTQENAVAAVTAVAAAAKIAKVALAAVAESELEIEDDE
jgi:hypothetical protein